MNGGEPMADLPPLAMPLEEAMRTQRALRRLRPDLVEDALVLRLIELALQAPTGRNAQHWEFVVVKDQAVKARLARLYRTANDVAQQTSHSASHCNREVDHAGLLRR